MGPCSDDELLLYHFLDECLYTFNSEEYFLGKRVVINEVVEKCIIYNSDPFKADFSNRVISRFTLHGEPMDLSKHSQGTEVKAITMHNLQINESEHRVDVYVLLDI